MNQFFDINRTMLFAKLKFSQNRKTLLLGIGGYLGLIFIITFFIAYGVRPGNYAVMNNFHAVALMILIIGGGMLIAARSCKDMNTPEKSIAQMMIPASTFEKFIVPFFFSSIVWVTLISIIYIGYAMLLNGVWGGLFGKDFFAYNIFSMIKDPDILEGIQAYFLIHSGFFLGGIAFKRYPIAKTFLTAFLVNISYTILSLLLTIIMFGGFVQFGIGAEHAANNLNLHEFIMNMDEESIERTVKLIFAFIIPVVLYIAAYFKLREREV